MKRIIIALAATLMAVAVVGSAAYAGQTETGNGAPSGAHYNLNIIGVENPKNADMTDTSRHTIFVPLTGNCNIQLAEGDDFAVLDGNCFSGGTETTIGTKQVQMNAKFQLPDPDPDADGTTTYSVFARALGKPGPGVGADMKTCGRGAGDDGVFGTADDELICSLITLQLKRESGGKQSFANVSKYLLYVYADVDGDGTTERVPLFSDELQDYFWAYDNHGLKLAQFRFYPGVCTQVPDASDPTGEQTIVTCTGS